MPDVSHFDNQDDWMKECVPKMIDEGKDQDQAVAACMSMWRERGSKMLQDLEDALKVGARNSGKDQQRLQMIHDYAKENGANCDMPDPEKMLINFGGEVKSLGDGRVGGYLIRFSDRDSPDLAGDYFTKDTDFGFTGSIRTPVWFHHRQPLKKRSGGYLEIRTQIGEGTLSIDDVGVLIDAIDYNRDEYEKAISKRNKKMGWSSGTAAHLVDRVKTGDAYWIKSWPLGLDASKTPIPAEPRNDVILVKSYQPSEIEIDPMPEREQENPSAEDEVKVKPEQSIITREENKMAEETQEVKQEVVPPDDWKPAFASLKSEWDALKKEKPETKTFAILTNGMGDSETKSLALYIRKGIIDPEGMKASNAVDMQYGNNAEGGYAVPLGFYNQIIARKSEMSLTDRLGLRPITGKGTTVNVPLDAEADGEFVATNEEAATDKDTPALGQAAMTLVKYTKRMLFSWELLEDEDANLLAFIADWIARGIAKTQNQLILTEVASGGTALKTFASATAIAAGELEGMVWNSNVTYYLDDGGSIAWVMRPSTYEGIAKLGSTSIRWYTPNPQGNSTPVMQPTLLGYPVYFSEKAAATAASAKDVYFGNWNYVGKREPSGLTLINDPYSNAATGQLTFHYYFRCVYKTLQAAAIGYGVHPSA